MKFTQLLPLFVFLSATLTWQSPKLKNDEDFKSLVNLSLKEGSFIWHVRNYSLPGFYLHGIRAGDFFQLKFSSFENGRLIYEMDKTETVMSIKVTDKAKSILEYYLNDESCKPDDYVFPLLSRDKDYSDQRYLKQQVESKTALVNTYLKKLAKQAEINKKVSFHVSRHFFASYAKDILENVYHVQKLLGHKDIKVTQEYLSEQPSTKLDQVSDLLFWTNRIFMMEKDLFDWRWKDEPPKSKYQLVIERENEYTKFELRNGQFVQMDSSGEYAIDRYPSGEPAY